MDDMDDSIQKNDSLDKMFHLMLDVGIGNNTEICQYMAFDYLKSILETDKYYVKRKKFFVDKREITIPFRLQFELTPAGRKLTPEQINRINECNRVVKYYEKESSLILTSCWTERITENALMWDRGEERKKVCIKTRIGNFVEAFGDIKFSIWCGKILYEPIKPVLMSSDILWYKEPYFSDEREIRFYFSADFSKIVPDVPCDEEGVFLPVKKDMLIQEIILSPYIKTKEAEDIKNSIIKTYGINTTLSKIKVI